MAPNESKITTIPIDGYTESKKHKKWAFYEPGEEVVISGIAGMFPDSDNVRHLEENLLAKKDLVTDDDRRWKPEDAKAPRGMGKLNEIDKFDAEFFGISQKTAEVMDPMGRILLEKTYEAIVDAGYNPKELKGSNTGVFIGTSLGAAEPPLLANRDLWNSDTIAGMVLCMLANRISYWLNVHGPSYTIDTACSSSLYALENAYKAIRMGDCDSAVVGGCNLCLQPQTSQLFQIGGYLSPEGRCKSFDESANGYCRSETVAVIFLQKQKNARRVYAQVVHAKSNCDGYKEEGIHFPSTQIQTKLLRELYDECDVNPKELKLIEAHATGTKVGDPQELGAIEAVLLPGRTEPLNIGSIKSSMGHSEPASGLCSIVKLILSYESGLMYPNIHLNNLRTDVEPFRDGRLKVVTETTPWNGGLTAVNNFGFGGANSHVLLQSNPKIKTKNGLHHRNLPRLVVVSGRTEEAVDSILSDLEGRPLDVEYVGLLHKIYEEDIPSHYFRGYILLKNDKEHEKSISEISGEKRPVWFVYTGMGCQWPKMGQALMKIPMFSDTIHKCHQILASKNIDLIKIISTEDAKMFDNILHSYLGIVAIQIALTDLLFKLDIKPEGFLGHSVGEIGCAYADGCLNAEEALLTAYYRGKSLLDTNLPEGSMAAIGLGHEKLAEIIPPEIDIGCHNGANSCTISGPKDVVKAFVESLTQEGVFAREVNSSNFALHSRYIKDAGEKFLEYLGNVNIRAKPRSKKWISSTFQERDWDANKCKNFAREYFITNMLGAVYFEEALQHVPKNAILIEIAPHGLLQAILKRSLGNEVTSIPLTSRSHPDNSEYFLCAVGRIFEAGANPRISRLYPPIDFPVSKGTPMISPLIKWDHSREWHVYKHGRRANPKVGQRTTSISLKEDEHKYLFGHVVNGRTIFPGTGYLVLVWESFCSMLGKTIREVAVEFQNVKLLRMTNLVEDATIDFVVTIYHDRNDFEISEKGDLVASGKIFEIKDDDTESIGLLEARDNKTDSENMKMSSSDVYKELRSRDYQYKGLFCGVSSIDLDGKFGRITWTDNFITFMDSMLHMKAIIESYPRPARVPVHLQKVIINPKKHYEIINSMAEEKKVLELEAYADKETDTLYSGGIEIEQVELATMKQRKPKGKLVMEKIDFVPYVNPNIDNFDQLIRVITLMIMENSASKGVKTVELVDEFTSTSGPLISQLLLDTFKDLPLIQANAGILAKSKHPLITEELKEEIEEVKNLPSEESYFVVIASHILKRGEILGSCLKSLKKRGFLLVREKLDETCSFDELQLNVCLDCKINNDRILLLRKPIENNPDPTVIKIVRDSYAWLTEVQKKVTEPSDLILYSEKDELSGIHGFFNCIREELKKENMRCFLILDTDAPPFSPSHPFYKSQVAKNLSMNVYKNGSWGGYYGLLLDEGAMVSTPHAYVNALVPGDLTTLKWIQGPLDSNTYNHTKDITLVHVYYASLNFRDVMLATGKISVDNAIRKHKKGEFSLGMEFAGMGPDGRRYMGYTTENAMTNLIECDYTELLPVPDNWTLEEAATVPLVYGTVFYALFMRAHMKPGESILIHSGAGGVGQAAINVCLYYGCEIFTTVGTAAKRNFIRKTFPSIPESHIGNSRDLSFEKMIRKQTSGKGVDIVLNSLSEEKLQASIRCLREKGRFLEIGKYDLSMNNSLGMKCFLKEISFHGIDLANIRMHEDSIPEFQKLMTNGLKEGIIKPLIRTVFAREQLESAFRFMSSGEHIGKVILRIREEELSLLAKPSPILMEAVPRYICKAEKSYIVCGGLGGFGLELIGWLIYRGAHNIIVTSRKGVTNGLQAKRIQLWRFSGANVVVCACDISNEDEVRKVLKTANSFGPVSAIFNLAAVVLDNLFENQTEKSFAESAAPKATGTSHLDKLSRKLCPYLEHFVGFSSGACGLGNPGQSNYGMSNSTLERICEMRRADNLPAMAIEWGAIADVGLLSEVDTNLVIGGTVQQDVTSCLEVLDQLLTKKNPVVRSMIVADKNSSKEKSLIDIICHILGIKDAKKVNQNAKLGDLGVDSITGLEIRNVLEKNYELMLQPKEIRDLTFGKLREIEANGGIDGTDNIENDVGDSDVVNDLGFEYMSAILNADLSFLDVDNSFLRLPSKLYTENSVEISHQKCPKMFLSPGMDGIPQFMEFLSVNLEAEVFCLLYNDTNQNQSVEGFAKEFFMHITDIIQENEPFYIIGFSFGALVAMETTRLLENDGYTGRLWIIDFLPKFFAEFSFPKIQGQNNYETASIPNIGNIDERRLPLLETMSMRLESTQQYVKRNHETIKNIVPSLIRTQKSVIPTEEDYGLSQYFQQKVNVHLVEGNHYSILKKPEVAEIIMNEMITHRQFIQSS